MNPFYSIIGLIIILGAVWFLVSQRNPVVLASFLIFLLPLDNLSLNIGPIRLRLAELLGVIFFLLIVFNNLRYHTDFIFPPGFMIMVTLVFIGLCVVLFSSEENFSKGIQMQLHIASLMIIAYVIYWLLLKIQDYKQAENIINHVVVIFLFIGLMQFCIYYLTGINLGHDGIYGLGQWGELFFYSRSAEPGISVLEMKNAPWFRPSSLLRESVLLGMLGSWFVALSFLRYISCPEKKWLWRLLLAGATVIISACRAAMMASLVTIVAAPFFLPQRQRLKKLKMALVIVIAIISVYFIAGQNLFSGRLEADFVREDIRWDMYLAQIDAFWRNPLIGDGPGSTEALIRAVMPTGWEPETVPTGGYSTLFTLLHDVGLVGLSLFLAFILKIFQEAKKTLKLHRVGLSPHGPPFFNGLLAMLVWGIFSPAFGVGLFWFGVALAWAFIKKDCLLMDAYRRQRAAL